MTEILSTSIALPLEREFEMWTVGQIEAYLHQFWPGAAIWALSPFVEHIWQADQKFEASGKLVGLQFKRPYLSRGVGYNELYWNLSKPRNQFDLIRRTPGIYYALPTFVNRKWKAEALNHCLFWRPGLRQRRLASLWYHGEKGRTGIERNSRCYRWGAFIERVMACTIGLETPKVIKVRDFVDRLNGTFVMDGSKRIPEDRIWNAEEGYEPDEGLYAIYIPFK